jgi:hypothetical protein
MNGVDIVWPDFARTLENELAAAKKRIADCEFVMAHRYDIIERQEPRCNEANARAEKAEAELVQLRAENDEMRVQIEANKRKGGGCQCADDEACAHVRRAEKAEAALAKAKATIEDICTGGRLTCDQCLETMPCNCGHSPRRL